MSNKLELFYSSFAGVDTRSSKLLQNPKSFRQGTKNFRYDFQDQTINRQGFQRKDDSAPALVDIFEYKFRDVNTGEAKTEILGVATNGKLYRKKNTYLKFNTFTGYTSVSVYYDEVALSFKIVLNGATPQTVLISDSLQLKDNPTTTASLVGKLNAISGVSTSLVDDSGATVLSSTLLAYLLDCVIEDTTFALNPVYSWEEVQSTFTGAVPFPTTRDYNTNSNYEGISSINLNNCIYITDGGFPMKYDGKAVYRCGVPEARQIFNPNVGLGGALIELGGLTVSSTIDSSRVPTGLSAGIYYYKWRFGFKDPYGAEYYGPLSQYGTAFVATGSFMSANINNIGYKYGKDFPVYSCVISSNTGAATVGGTGADGAVVYSLDTILTANVNATTITIDPGVNVYLNGYTLFRTGIITNSGTINNSVTARSGGTTTYVVASGHNVVVGQCLAFKQYVGSNTISTQGYFQAYYYAKVTATTATSITVTTPVVGAINAYPGQVINAAWVPSNLENVQNFVGRNEVPYGSFLQIFRSKKDQVQSMDSQGPFYIVGCGAVPYDSSGSYSLLDDSTDIQLINLFDDLEPGSEIPRACKYLTNWQNQLVQSGRTVNPSLQNSEYPTSSVAFSAATYKELAIYTEALLCDFQSIYWADVLSPEGFPQDGLHEFIIDTKFADRVTAIAPNKDALFALKERSTGVLTGSLAENNVVLEVLESDAGCSSHKTVEEVRGSLVWLDGINGFYSCVAGRLPENVGFPIQDYQKINTQKLNYRTATAANYRKESLYICSVGTTTFVLDYADNGSTLRNCWYIWDGFDGKSVLATSDDLFLMWDGTRTNKYKLTLTVYDHSDHKSAIPMVLNTAWLNQGHPTIDKHYVGLWINSIQGNFTLTVKQYGNFLSDVIGTQTNVQFIAETSSKKAIKAQVKASLPKLSAISFGMENAQVNKKVQIQGYEVQYSSDFSVGEPKK